MLPPEITKNSFNMDISTNQNFSCFKPIIMETSQCNRPQMAYKVYERLLQLAKNQQQPEVNKRDIWLAAFTGCNLLYQMSAGDSQQ